MLKSSISFGAMSVVITLSTALYLSAMLGYSTGMQAVAANTLAGEHAAATEASGK